MTTFSQLIDAMASETKRPGLRDAELVSYLNQTLRECHFDPETNAAQFLIPNYFEDQLTADVESTFYWTIPNVATFQGLSAVRFDSSLDQNGIRRYAERVNPGRRFESKLYTYQQAGDRVFFKGYGGLNAVISVAWFEYPRALKYYAVADRPASYDSQAGWTYHEDYDADDDTKQEARELTSNWLLLRWPMVLEEGLRAKIYKRLSDQNRQQVAYSLFQQQRRGLIISESADISGGYFSG